MKKTIHNNDVTGHIGVVDAENRTELSRPIEKVVKIELNYHKNHIGQRCDQSYKYDICIIPY